MADHPYRDRERGSSIFPGDRGPGDRGPGGGSEPWRSEERAGGSSERWHGEQRLAGGGGGYGQDYRSHSPTGSQSHGSSGDRGFFDRAGDEVRSWFGDEEAERRREADARRYEQEHGTSGRYQGGGHEDQWTGGSASGGRYPQDRQYSHGGYGQDRPSSGYGGNYGSGGSGSAYGDGSNQSAYGQPRQGQGASQPARSFGGRQEGDHYGARGGQAQQGETASQSGSFSRADYDRGGGSSGQSGAAHDEAYRRWRDQQIAALDQEYQEYCQHRQHQFEQDFSSFRQSRQSVTSGGPTMSHGGALRGTTEISGGDASQGESAHMSGESAGRNAAATTTGGGTASAATSSVGSTGMAAETGNVPGSAGSGKSGKSR